MPASPLSDNTAITVSELNGQAKSLLENSFFSIRVQGEISNFARPSSGHWYFSLKDSKAQIRCAMFRGNNSSLRFTPKEGDQIIVQGRVSLYEARGDYQLICEHMESAGSGRLLLAFQQLKDKLNREGLFSNDYKRELPKYPRRVGVITSPSGAAIRDVLTVLKRRFPGLPVNIYPAAVQGNEAPGQLIKALQDAVQHQQCDVLVIGRGGGSLEDLWAFNDEALARAIFACPIPIVSAVGHEVDFTISDLVADKRAATPSAAAELISPDQDALRILLDRQSTRLTRQMASALTRHRQTVANLQSRLRSPADRLVEQRHRLESLSQRLIASQQHSMRQKSRQLEYLQQRLQVQNPNQRIALLRRQLEEQQQQLQRSFTHQLENKRNQLARTVGKLHAVSPLATMERGYSISFNQAGQALTSSQQLSLGEQITTRLHSGEITSQVVAIEQGETSTES